MTIFLTIIGLIILIASCGGPAERMRNRAAVEPSPSPTPGEREISGVFNVEGAAVNDKEPYTGVLNIANQGDVYGFRWATTKGSRVGTGVQMGNATAASPPALVKAVGLCFIRSPATARSTGGSPD
ncbi:MAG: hypothetical protein ABIV48_07130, partial [Pyrinomonadaceae bacterium]